MHSQSCSPALHVSVPVIVTDSTVMTNMQPSLLSRAAILFSAVHPVRPESYGSAQSANLKYYGDALLPRQATAPCFNHDQHNSHGISFLSCGNAYCTQGLQSISVASAVLVLPAQCSLGAE